MSFQSSGIGGKYDLATHAFCFYVHRTVSERWYRRLPSAGRSRTATPEEQLEASCWIIEASGCRILYVRFWLSECGLLSGLHGGRKPASMYFMSSLKPLCHSKFCHAERLYFNCDTLFCATKSA